MGIKLVNNSGYKWFNKDGISVRGYFFYKGKYYDNKKMLSIFKDIVSIEAFKKKLKEINGYYSIVINKDNILLASTDRINSAPLFFKKTNNELLISDDFRNLIKENNIQINKTSKYEYLLAGYTTGNNTLSEEIKQLKPGEILFYKKSKDKVKLSRYYKYLDNNKSNLKEKELLNKLHNTHKEVFKRFIKSLNGRKVILPLSGGYDSRLILEMLDKYNYKNVICFTWGRKNDWEVRIAKNVAKNLNYKWLRILPSRKDWHNWYGSEDFFKLNIYTGLISSIPYIQENVSIKYLQEKMNIPSDSIFVSGNSGDFIEGKHIPKEIAQKKFFSSKELSKLIYKNHYSLFNLKQIDEKEKIYERIFDIIGTSEKYNFKIAANLFEYWEWQERQAKFVSNSIKPFEINGYEWRLPLWDDEIMDFWRTVPFNYRYNRSLFYKYAENFMKQEFKKANPKSKIRKLKNYQERVFDNRYACFNGNYSFLKSFFSKDKEIFDSSLLEIVENKILLKHKFNGLVSLKNLILLEKIINYHKKYL